MSSQVALNTDSSLDNQEENLISLWQGFYEQDLDGARAISDIIHQ